jgi:hypothetical protein
MRQEDVRTYRRSWLRHSGNALRRILWSHTAIAHTSPRDTELISGFLGKSNNFDQGVVAIAMVHADQNEKVRAAMLDAVKSVELVKPTRSKFPHCSMALRFVVSRYHWGHDVFGNQLEIYVPDRDGSFMKDRTAVVPWYPSPECYEQFRRTAVDRELFFSSHREWIDAAAQHERAAEEHGVVILRICMQYEAFEQWMASKQRLNELDSRSEFAEERAKDLHAWYADPAR